MYLHPASASRTATALAVGLLHLAKLQVSKVPPLPAPLPQLSSAPRTAGRGPLFSNGDHASQHRSAATYRCRRALEFEPLYSSQSDRKHNIRTGLVGARYQPCVPPNAPVHCGLVAGPLCQGNYNRVCVFSPILPALRAISRRWNAHRRRPVDVIIQISREDANANNTRHRDGTPRPVHSHNHPRSPRLLLPPFRLLLRLLGRTRALRGKCQTSRYPGSRTRVPWLCSDIWNR